MGAYGPNVTGGRPLGDHRLPARLAIEPRWAPWMTCRRQLRAQLEKVIYEFANHPNAVSAAGSFQVAEGADDADRRWAAIALVDCGCQLPDADSEFAFSWLLAFMFFLSLGLGGLFLVMVHHLVDAGWSVPIRRILRESGVPVVSLDGVLVHSDRACSPNDLSLDARSCNAHDRPCSDRQTAACSPSRVLYRRP